MHDLAPCWGTWSKPWPTTGVSTHQSWASCDANNTDNAIWDNFSFFCEFFGARGCLENCGHRLGCDYKEDASSYLVGNSNDTHGQEKRRDIIYRNTVRQLGRLIWTKYIITWLQIYKYNFTDTNSQIQIHKYICNRQKIKVQKHSYAIRAGEGGGPLKIRDQNAIVPHSTLCTFLT